MKKFIEHNAYSYKSDSVCPLMPSKDGEYISRSALEAFMEGKVVVDDAILILIDALPYSKIAEGNSLLCSAEKYNLIIKLLNATQEGE